MLTDKARQLAVEALMAVMMRGDEEAAEIYPVLELIGGILGDL